MDRSHYPYSAQNILPPTVYPQQWPVDLTVPMSNVQALLALHNAFYVILHLCDTTGAFP